jgi:hypothetical protein
MHIRFVTYFHELLELQEMQLVGDGIQVTVACLSGTKNMLRTGRKM